MSILHWGMYYPVPRSWWLCYVVLMWYGRNNDYVVWIVHAAVANDAVLPSCAKLTAVDWWIVISQASLMAWRSSRVFQMIADMESPCTGPLSYWLSSWLGVWKQNILTVITQGCYTQCSKKQPLCFLIITSANINDFQSSFTDRFPIKLSE